MCIPHSSHTSQQRIHEKAKEDFTKECAAERAQNQHHHEHANNEQYGHCSEKQKDATSSGLLSMGKNKKKGNIINATNTTNYTYICT
ncbi:hypothetical protein POVWA2_015050 [Plasmodium ovale wallikeri]|uniref:Uncharacterized protein n=1 Tax=Plasmodium ovale wallikeri TaxID=864142 RepID=A0A1A8YPR0_PLAOA|nr:hypothetical protein POVWA2_015050 [Plasmodium ovale wallikeri]SBT33900.1 hypothetical protein POVWA1_019450 [Plasmodium ovale wallikeri]